MNAFETVVVSDYGTEKLTGDKAQLVNRARKRKYDGQPDRRTNDGKIAWFIILAAIDRMKANYLAVPH
jgi:hypothetical protein